MSDTSLNENDTFAEEVYPYQISEPTSTESKAFIFKYYSTTHTEIVTALINADNTNGPEASEEGSQGSEEPYEPAQEEILVPAEAPE